MTQTFMKILPVSILTAVFPGETGLAS